MTRIGHSESGPDNMSSIKRREQWAQSKRESRDKNGVHALSTPISTAAYEALKRIQKKGPDGESHPGTKKTATATQRQVLERILIAEDSQGPINNNCDEIHDGPLQELIFLNGVYGFVDPSGLENLIRILNKRLPYY